jgi:hypothetical protein
MDAQTGAIVGLGVLLALGVVLKTIQSKKAAAAAAAQQEASALTKRKNWLEGVGGAVKGKTFHIGQRTVTMGRKPTNFIQIDDHNVSRVQCQLRATDAGLELIDIESSNGTYVNGQKVEPNKPRLLKHGDRLKLGDAELVYHKMANFTTNHGLIEMKQRGEQFESQTAMVGGSGWEATLRAELDKAGGDIDTAARNMKIQPAVLRQMIKQAGIRLDQPASMATAINIELERAGGDIEVVAKKMGISVSTLLDIMAQSDD